MSAIKLRSTSTNSRLKINSRLDTSTILSNVNSSIVNSSNSFSKSRERLPLKLPRIAPSSRDSIDTSHSLDLNEESIQSLKNSLLQEWEKRSVPKDLQKVFNEKVWSLPRHKAITIVSRELEDIRKNRSAMMSALRAVISREESLNSIYEMEKFLMQVPNWEKLKDVHLECAELLHAHRILTINAVETIEKWRDMIRSSALINNESSSMHFPFMHNEVNYLVKIRNDLDFLVNSEFSKVFVFEKTDPLLIKPSIPSLKIKEKKIDSNYFIQHGQVVVSLPSSLRVKVDFAAEILAVEVKFENRLEPKQVEEISQVIYEELCEEEVKNDAEFYFGNNRNQVLGPLSDMLANDMLDEIFKEVFSEVKQEKNVENNEKVAKDLAEEMVNKEIEQSLKQIVSSELKLWEKEKKDTVTKQQRIKEENENLARAIYSDLFNTLLISFISENVQQSITDSQATITKQNLAKLTKENHQIAEQIRNSLIDQEIQLTLKSLSDDLQHQKDLKNSSDSLYTQLLNQLLTDLVTETYLESKSQIDQKKHKNLENLSEKIFFDLVDQLLPDLKLLAQETFDYEVQLYSDRSELLENVGLEFLTHSEGGDFSGFEFKKINAPDSVFPKIVEEYFPKIPDEEKCVTADQEVLEEEIEKLQAHWYWGIKGKFIVGLLVFSVDFDRNDVRVINVHHLTCLNWKVYKEFIEQALKFVWESDHCQEVRVNLYVSGNPEIPGHIKKIFNALHFRWKTNYLNEEEELSIIVMGKIRPQISLPNKSPKKAHLLPKPRK